MSEHTCCFILYSCLFSLGFQNGRCVVILFFKEIAFLPWLCSSPAACHSGRCCGARIYHCAFFFSEWHILMGHCLEQWSKAWCVPIHEVPLLFTLLWFPSGSIRYQSSFKEKQNNQPHIVQKQTKIQKSFFFKLIVTGINIYHSICHWNLRSTFWPQFYHYSNFTDEEGK